MSTLQPRIVLAFDTSGPWIAAALHVKGAIRASRHDEMARGQAERLMGFLEEMLAGEGLGWGDVEALGVGVGPGNFTGIRISVATARGLAFARTIPAHGVSRFEALAFGQDLPALVSLDARRDRLWLALVRNGRPEAPMQVALDEIAGAPALVTVPAETRVIGDRAEEVAARLGLEAAPPALPLAEAIAEIATRRDPAAARPPTPLYLRPADASPPSEPPVPIIDE